MRILSIDSSLGTQLAVVDATDTTDTTDIADIADTADAGGRALRVLSRTEQADSRRHAESLGQMLSEALSAEDVAECPPQAVVVATGPAPFTGLRAGLVTARVVGRTRGLPVHGVSSLDAVARRALDELAAGLVGDGRDPLVLVAVVDDITRAVDPDAVIGARRRVVRVDQRRGRLRVRGLCA